MVAVVCSPAQGKFRKVAGANYHPPGLVGNIHQYLRTLTRLRIFIHHIVYVDIMVYIFEVLDAGILYADLAHGYA